MHKTDRNIGICYSVSNCRIVAIVCTYDGGMNVGTSDGYYPFYSFLPHCPQKKNSRIQISSYAIQMGVLPIHPSISVCVCWALLFRYDKNHYPSSLELARIPGDYKLEFLQI